LTRGNWSSAKKSARCMLITKGKNQPARKKCPTEGSKRGHERWGKKKKKKSRVQARGERRGVERMWEHPSRGKTTAFLIMPKKKNGAAQKKKERLLERAHRTRTEERRSAKEKRKKKGGKGRPRVEKTTKKTKSKKT